VLGCDEIFELDFRTVAHPYVEQLARKLGHSVVAGVLEGSEVVYVDVVHGRDGLRLHRPIGGRISVHLSSIGQAILAYLPAAEVGDIVAGCRFEPRTPHTISQHDAFLLRLQEVRRQGWALVRDEETLGATSFSAPVFDHTGRVVGAIGVAGSSFVLQDATIERTIGLLVEVCRAVSAELGHGIAAPVGPRRESAG
jgi:DNA-binding IclR family transcriptional regulator